MFGRKTRLMKQLAKELGLDYWPFDGGKFLHDSFPKSSSIVGRLERLENGCNCGGLNHDHYSWCASKTSKQVNASQQDFNLLLDFLGLKIVDGPRIISTKVTPQPRKKSSRKPK